MQGLRLWGVTSRSTVFEDKLFQILFISFLNSASQSRWARTPEKKHNNVNSIGHTLF